MNCVVWRIIRRPEYREDLDAIEAWIARDNVSAAVAMWLLIDDQVEQLADPNFRAGQAPVRRERMSWWRTRTTSCTSTRTKATAASPSGLSCMWPDSFRSTCQRWEVCAWRVRGGNGASEFQRPYVLEMIGLLIAYWQPCANNGCIPARWYP